MSNFNTSFGYRGIAKILDMPTPRVHFLGIGGVGMYSLVRMAQKAGYTVTGSDKSYTERVRELASFGAVIVPPADTSLVTFADAAVYSLAISESDPEFVCAREHGIPLISRADFLSYLSYGYGIRIGVSGAHGKSTVTSMLADIFNKGGTSPTVASGASLRHGSPYLEGGDGSFIYEACEYCDSFLATDPTVAVINNIDLDHVDYFKNEDSLVSSFLRFANKASDFAVVFLDDPLVKRLIPSIKASCVTVGSELSADYRFTVDAITERGTKFSLIHGDECREFTLNIPGVYNISNAAMAAATSLELGISPDAVRRALSEFSAVERRLEPRGYFRGRILIYDYAHHPTEIAAAISAVKTWYSDEVTVLFKPHTYTRTKALFDGFVSSLSLADYVFVTDIYPAREEAIDGVNSSVLADAIGDMAKYIKESDAVRELSKTRGAILIMGAGEYGELLRELNVE